MNFSRSYLEVQTISKSVLIQTNFHFDLKDSHLPLGPTPVDDFHVPYRGQSLNVLFLYKSFAADYTLLLVLRTIYFNIAFISPYTISLLCFYLSIPYRLESFSISQQFKSLRILHYCNMGHHFTLCVFISIFFSFS